MKKILDIHRRCLWLCFPILACQVPPNSVQASDEVRIPLLEVAYLSARSLPIIGRRTGVSSMGLDVDPNYHLLTVQASKPQMGDRGHLVLKCSHAPCLLIFLGSLSERASNAVTAAYDGKLLVPPPPPAEPRISDSLFPPIPDANRPGT